MKKLYIYISLVIMAAFSFNSKAAAGVFIKGLDAFVEYEAGSADAEWVSNQAVNFCLENKELLGNDRELDGLAVAAILSYSPESVKEHNGNKN